MYSENLLPFPTLNFEILDIDQSETTRRWKKTILTHCISDFVIRINKNKNFAVSGQKTKFIL